MMPYTAQARNTAWNHMRYAHTPLADRSGVESTKELGCVERLHPRQATHLIDKAPGELLYQFPARPCLLY